MEFFFKPQVGNRAGDFYFKCNKNGSRYYYSRITGKRVAKEDIPASVINAVQPYDGVSDQAELLKLRNGYVNHIRLLEEKVREIDAKLDKSIDSEKVQSDHAEQLKKDEERRQEYKQEQKRKIDDFIRKFAPKTSEKSGSADNNNSKSADDSNNRSILEKFNITTKKEWKSWLINNHSDRGGDIKLCQSVIAAGRAAGW